jgi:hypothetical protein
MTLDDLQQQRDRIDRTLLRTNERVVRLRILAQRLLERRAEIEQQAWLLFGKRLSS